MPYLAPAARMLAVAAAAVLLLPPIGLAHPLRDAETTIGVLESVNTGGRRAHHARILFRKAGAEWKAYLPEMTDEAALKASLDALPETVSWTVAFDGRSLGALTSKRPSSIQLYAEVGTHLVDAAAKIPTVGAPETRFAGFVDEGPVYRPLVLTSSAHVADPEQWKPHTATAKELALVKEALGKQFSLSSQALSRASVRAVRAYKSRTNGATLVSVNVTKIAELPIEAATESDDPEYLLTFVIRNAETRQLAPNLTLVDAGDYDGDGSSEVLFKRSAYNADGYVLYSDGFSKSAELSWSHH